MQQYFNSVFIALLNIKSNPLHTILSILGIIIGVASLVAILSLADGLEQTGREQIETTTSIQMMRISPSRTENVNGVNVPRDTIYHLKLKHARELEQAFQSRAIVEMISQQTARISYRDTLTATYVQGSMENALQFTESALTGEFFTSTDINKKHRKIVLSSDLAKVLGDSTEELLGEFVMIKDNAFKVIGLLEKERIGARAIIPISVYNDLFKVDNFPAILVKAKKVEDLPALKSETEDWLERDFETGKDAFSIFTYENRVEQLSQGILVFKLVMGAITGISVLVGGIGIMNVLLISVTERTKEIGIRKATGARKKDIVLQFLSESVTISLVGCIIGWMIGLSAVFGMVELITHFTEIRFQAAATMGTVLVVLALAVLIGIIFGTYPAWKAANLTPVDAIRHE